MTGSVAVLLATASPTHPCAARAWSWCACVHVPQGHKLTRYSPSCTSQRDPVQPSSQKQEPEPPRPSSQRPCGVQRQAGEKGKLTHGTKEVGQDRVGRGRDDPPWHWGPKAPGAQSSQADPAKPGRQLHCPLPLIPSWHAPWSLQGLLGPPGQAGEECRRVMGPEALMSKPTHPHPRLCPLFPY